MKIINIYFIQVPEYWNMRLLEIIQKAGLSIADIWDKHGKVQIIMAIRQFIEEIM